MTAPLTTRRNYTNTAAQAKLLVGIDASAVSFTIDTATGFPPVPFTAALDYLGASEETILVTAMTGTTVTNCTRGYDGSAAQDHALNALFVHVLVAQDADEANEHSSSTGAHGKTSPLVGETDVQTVTNKTISSSKNLATATEPAVKAQAAGSGSAPLLLGLDSTGAITLWQVGRGGAVQISPNDPNVVTLLAKMAAGQTANGIELRTNGGSPLWVADKDGKIVHKPAGYPGMKLVNPDGTQADVFQVRDSTDSTTQTRIDSFGVFETSRVLVKGLFANDPLAYPADGSKWKVDSNGNVSANNLPQVPSSKKGKQINWGSATANTDASGYDTITHGLGFTPTLVVAFWSGQSLGGMNAQIAGTDSYTSTTFRLRAISAASSSFTVRFVGFE